jgi:hypothetical protein
MKVYVDSVVIIYYLDYAGAFHVRAAHRLAALHAVGDDIVVSDLVRMECRVDPIRQGDTLRLARFDGFSPILMYKLCPSRPLYSTERRRCGQPTVTRRLMRSIWPRLLKPVATYS